MAEAICFRLYFYKKDLQLIKSFISLQLLLQNALKPLDDIGVYVYKKFTNKNLNKNLTIYETERKKQQESGH